MRSISLTLAVLVALVLVACSPSSGDHTPAGKPGGVTGSASGGQTGSGGRAGSGGADSTGAGGGQGGTTTGAGGANCAGGAGGTISPPGDAAPVPDATGIPGQGPTALGRIVYTQDFEQGMAGMTLSPTNLPADRMTIVDDPLKLRGKVVQALYKERDNFRTSGGTEPRSWLSNASGYQIAVGTKVSLAWGTMFPNIETNAYFAQTIGPGPVWELRVLSDGRFNILCNKCGRNSYHMPMFANRWYDFRVDMDWRNGGMVSFYVDGQMVHQAVLSGATAACHWDGGIYWARDAPSRPTRTVYISNLSVGVRE